MLSAHRPILEEISAERRRQIEVEGFTPQEHDDAHAEGELATAASTYAQYASSAQMHAAGLGFSRGGYAPARWPWLAAWWKPQDRRRDLVKAAALLVAEIERLDRQAARG